MSGLFLVGVIVNISTTAVIFISYSDINHHTSDGRIRFMAAASSSEVLWVRLKPRDPQRGFKLRRYTVFGYTFVGERGWYKVPSKIKGVVANEDVDVDMKTYMAEIRNDNDNPDSALAFDVCTKEEAAAITKREREAKEKNQSDNPVDLTTGDFGRNRREAAAKRAPGRPRRDRDDD